MFILRTRDTNPVRAVRCISVTCAVFLFRASSSGVMNLAGVQGDKARYFSPVFKMEKSDTGKTYANVEGLGYRFADVTAWTCCLCRGINALLISATHHERITPSLFLV